MTRLRGAMNYRFADSLRSSRSEAFSTIIFISLIAPVLILAGQSYAKIDPGAVIGIWFLDEDKGGVAKDSSGNGHDGEIIGNLKVVNARFNKGFEFDGVLGNYVSVPHDKSLNLAEFTITYWCNMGVSGAWQIPVLKVDGAAGGSHRNVDFQTPPEGGDGVRCLTAMPQASTSTASIFLKGRISGEALARAIARARHNRSLR